MTQRVSLLKRFSLHSFSTRLIGTFFREFHSEKFQLTINSNFHTITRFTSSEPTCFRCVCACRLSCRIVKLNSFSYYQEAAAITHDAQSFGLKIFPHIFSVLRIEQKIEKRPRRNSCDRDRADFFCIERNFREIEIIKVTVC